MRDKPNSRKEQAARMKKKIQKVAEQLFAEKGIENVSMTDIADVIGCSTGNIYYHFKSKEALAASLSELDFEKYRDLVDAFRKDAKTPPLQKLYDFMQAAIVLQSDEPYIYHGLSYSLVGSNKEYTKDNSTRLFAEYIKELVDECIADGSISEKVDADDLAQAYVIIMRGCMLHYYFGGAEFDIASVARKMAEIFTAGINA
jgi:AcrR family transcriptional regulator